MARIRKITIGTNLDSVVALHAFNVNSEGDLIYTKSTETADLVDESKSVNKYFNVDVRRNSSDTGNVYYLNDVENPQLFFQRKESYILDQSDRSNNNHPMKFSDVEDGQLAGGATYNIGVKYVLDGAEVTETNYTNGFVVAQDRKIYIDVDANAPQTLYYWCTYHLGMGNSIVVGDNNLDSAYKFYEIGTAGYTYSINDEGELIFEYETSE